MSLNSLILGSKSPSRRLLLTEAGIPFEVAPQSADESACDWGLPLEELVQSIALFKMDHVILEPGKREGEIAFVLTADTLSQDLNGLPSGKPTSREDAISKLRAAREGTRLCTAFCLDRKVWKSEAWIVEKRIEQTVESWYQFVVPEEWIDRYLEHSLGMTASNAIAIEGYGGQFLRYVKGSYTTIVGLPMQELREALESIGFFANSSL